MRLLFAVALATAAMTPAIAADPVPAAPEAKPAKEKKVCRANDDQSGTRLGRRTTCKTQAEWDADREATQRAMDARR